MPMGRVATMTTATPEPSTLLGLMWLSSAALPVGGFSYSEGLEAAVEAGQVHDAASAGRWLGDQLELSIVRAEWPIVARAQAAFAALDPLAVRAANDWVLRTRETAELRLQTEQMGRSLVEWMRAQVRGEAAVASVQGAPGMPGMPDRQAEVRARLALLQDLPGPPTWPVAFALSAWRTGAGLRQTLLAHGFSWAENQVQAAIKCVPLGQTAGQQVLARLTQALARAVEAFGAAEDAKATAPEPIAFMPGLAILSARHESQYTRLFRS